MATRKLNDDGSPNYDGSNAIAGTINGVPYKELAGSGSVRVSEESASARRVIRIPYSSANIKALIEGLTRDPINPKTVRSGSITSKAGASLRDFPYWPGRYATGVNDEWGTRLVVKDIEIEPSHRGRQAGIGTAAWAAVGANGAPDYAEADVTITYGLEAKEQHLAQISSRGSSRIVKGYYTITTGGGHTNEGDPIDVEEIDTTTEIMFRVRFSETSYLQTDTSEGDRASVSSDAKLRNLRRLLEKIGTVNDDVVTLRYGTTKDAKHRFKARSLLLVSADMEPSFRFGLLDTEIVYRFLVAPAYQQIESYTGPGIPSGSVKLAGNTWDWAFDAKANEWVQVTPSPYQETDFSDLFWWSTT